MAAPSPGPPPTSAATSAGGSPSMVEAPPAAPTCAWTRQQEKLFENALAMHDQDAPDRWEKIAAMVTGKDAAAIKRHYDLLVEDVNSIEAGRVPLPPYSSAAVSATECMGEPAVGSGESSSAKKSGGFSVGHSPVVGVTSNGSGGNSGPGKGTPKSSDQERRKGIPWTEDEHRLFLLGLDKFGKGDWRSISRNFVISRTPTQVASHAQKYFIRLNSMNRDRRRSSIHDITSVNNGDSTQPCQGPITGQGAVGQPVTHIATSGLAGAAVYGAPVGQPIAGPVGSAVGTPVLLPPPGVAGPYVSRGPMPRPVMPGAPMAVVPVAYPLAQPVPQPIPQQPVHR